MGLEPPWGQGQGRTILLICPALHIVGLFLYMYLKHKKFLNNFYLAFKDFMISLLLYWITVVIGEELMKNLLFSNLICLANDDIDI